MGFYKVQADIDREIDDSSYDKEWFLIYVEDDSDEIEVANEIDDKLDKLYGYEVLDFNFTKISSDPALLIPQEYYDDFIKLND